MCWRGRREGDTDGNEANSEVGGSQEHCCEGVVSVGRALRNECQMKMVY